jgi:hypothetical protein
MIHPITFSIPEEKIVSVIPNKTKILSSLIPGQMETYIYSTESEYYDEYKRSMFATTTKKGGWDCMRHYEILANGCIPYFPNIEECPPNTMSLFPKELVYEGNMLYTKICNKNINELTMEELQQYNDLVSKFLNYTKNKLTTTTIAKYILDKTNHSTVKNILYLSGNPFPDYLRCVTLHGFKKIFGKCCHDYPKITHIYKSANKEPYLPTYGKGFTYSHLLDQVLHNDYSDYNIEEIIRRKHYDIVIYGSYHRGMPYFDLVNSVYKPNEIILLCGEDLHCCSYNDYINKGYNVFVREL